MPSCEYACWQQVARTWRSEIPFFHLCMCTKTCLLNLARIQKIATAYMFASTPSFYTRPFPGAQKAHEMHTFEPIAKGGNTFSSEFPAREWIFPCLSVHESSNVQRSTIFILRKRICLMADFRVSRLFSRVS